MTGYTVHTGSSEKFSEGWDQIFVNKPKTEKPSTSKAKADSRKVVKPVPQRSKKKSSKNKNK